MTWFVLNNWFWLTIEGKASDLTYVTHHVRSRKGWLKRIYLFSCWRVRSVGEFLVSGYMNRHWLHRTRSATNTVSVLNKLPTHTRWKCRGEWERPHVRSRKGWHKRIILIFMLTGQVCWWVSSFWLHEQALTDSIGHVVQLILYLCWTSYPTCTWWICRGEWERLQGSVFDLSENWVYRKWSVFP